MISKESFIKTLAAIRKQRELDNSNSELLTKFADPESDFRDVVFTTPMVGTIIEILASEMKSRQDAYFGNDIEYWIYEADYGENYDTIWQNDRAVSVKTAGDLYDFLTGDPKYTFEGDK